MSSEMGRQGRAQGADKSRAPAAPRGAVTRLGGMNEAAVTHSDVTTGSAMALADATESQVLFATSELGRLNGYLRETNMSRLYTA